MDCKQSAREMMHVAAGIIYYWILEQHSNNESGLNKSHL